MNRVITLFLSIFVFTACFGSAVSANELNILRRLSFAKGKYFLLNQEIVQALEELDDIVNRDVVMWVASMYDPTTGGFYYARSAIGREGFAADLESTSQALDFIRSMGMFDAMPSHIRQKFINFFQSRQDEATGYFYDPQFGTDVTDSKRSRNLSKSVRTLRDLGTSPLYPLPFEEAEAQGAAGVNDTIAKQSRTVPDLGHQIARTVATSTGGRPFQNHSPHPVQVHASPRSSSMRTVSTSEVRETASTASKEPSKLPEYLTSARALRQWMESFDWENNPYSAGHNVSSAHSEIKQVGLLDTVYEFIEAIQNKETGFWGAGRTFEELSAAMKLSVYYGSSSERPYPHADKMLESILITLEEDVPESLSAIYNVPFIIRTAIIEGPVPYDPDFEALLLDKLPSIIRSLKSSILRFKQPDKSYSYHVRGSSMWSQGSRVSLGLPEADMNATILATDTVRFLHDIVGAPGPKMTQYASEFWETIENMKSHSAVTAGLNQDFEDETSSGWSSSTPTSGEMAIVRDPQETENRVLKIEKRNPVIGYSASTSFEADPGASTTCISLKFIVSDLGDRGAFSLLFGAGRGQSNWALDFVIRQLDGKYVISHRTSDRGYGVEIGEIAADEWNRFQIEYSPAGLDDTEVTIRLNDDRIVTKSYYNAGDDSRLPVTDIKHIEVYGWSTATGVLYLDDIKVQSATD